MSTQAQSFQLLVPQERHDRPLLVLLAHGLLPGLGRVALVLRQLQVVLETKERPEPEGPDDGAPGAGGFVGSDRECTHGHRIIISDDADPATYTLEDGA